jgi:PmbA protein
MRIDKDFAGRLLDGALRGGADFAEVYVRSARNLSVEVKGQVMDALESSIDFGYSLRVIRDQRLGFSFSTDTHNSDTVISSAIEASKWTARDEHLCFPEPSVTNPVDTFDKELSGIDEETALRKALAIESAALRTDRRIRRVRKAAASFSTRDVAILNSKGVNGSYAATSCTAQLMAVAEDADDSQMAWDFEGSRFLQEVSFEKVGETAARRALMLLGAGKVRATKADIILDNSVAAEFLGIFSSLLSSESVQKGKSLLARRVNEEVVSPAVSIFDDGGIPCKLGSRPFDDEGVATSRKFLIKEGVLIGYLHNCYTARKDGVMSTGNAAKGGLSALPSVGPSNLCISVSPASVHHGDLSALSSKGLYVTDAMGVHTANPVSGEFSIGVSGVWIERGRLCHPVKEAVISGNLLDFFKKVEAAGDDLRFFGNLAAPSLLIPRVDISA